MARVDLAYARSLLRVAEPADLLRVVARRVGERLSRKPAPVAVDAEAARLGAAALGRAPKLFDTTTIAADYQTLFPRR